DDHERGERHERRDADDPTCDRGHEAIVGATRRRGLGGHGVGTHDSSSSGPKASIPIPTNNTAKIPSRATHGQASDVTPSIDASHARVAPSSTGATTGSSSTGTSVSRARIPAARTP